VLLPTFVVKMHLRELENQKIKNQKSKILGAGYYP